MIVAILFAEPNGVYSTIDDVDIWGTRARSKRAREAIRTHLRGVAVGGGQSVDVTTRRVEAAMGHGGSRPRTIFLFQARQRLHELSRGINVPFLSDERDARSYDGDYPVVAHPPCARWCRLAGLVEARWGYQRGDDGGTFAAALAAVRRCGGVLEHPAHSDAWKAFGLAPPSRDGGWLPADDVGGYTCHVEQGRYGHPAKKATWLYAHVSDPSVLPELRWGTDPDNKSKAIVSRRGNRVSKGMEGRRRLSPKEASATPIEFAEELIKIARMARPNS